MHAAQQESYHKRDSCDEQRLRLKVEMMKARPPKKMMGTMSGRQLLRSLEAPCFAREVPELRWVNAPTARVLLAEEQAR